MSITFPSLTAIDWVLSALVLAIICCAIYLFGNYCTHCIDQAWTASFGLNFIQNETYVEDLTFANSAGDFRFFGMTLAYVNGKLAATFSTHPYFFALISTCFTLLSNVFWYLGFKRLFNRNIALFTTLCLFIATTSFGVSQINRPEALLFLLCSVSFCCASYRYYFIAAILAGICIEIHPMGFICFIYLTGVLLITDDRKLIKHWLAIGIAGLIGLGYFLLLHHPYLELYQTILSQARSTNFIQNNFIFDYFFDVRFFKNVPEAFLLFAMIVVTLIKKNAFSNTAVRLSLLWLIAILLFSLLIGRSNTQYGIYLLPPLFLLSISQLYQLKIFKPIIVLIAVFYLLQYMALIYINGHFRMHQYHNQISQHLPIKSEGTIYLGHSNHWFTFINDPDRQFYTVQGHDFNFLKNQRFIWIRDSIWESINAQPTTEFQKLAKKCPMKLLSHFDYGRHSVRFEQYDCRKIAP